MKRVLLLILLAVFSANAHAFLSGCTDQSMTERKLLKVVKKRPLPNIVNLKSLRLPRPDSLFLSKSTRQLFLIKNKKAYKVYTVVLGQEPIGAKLREGDNRTPEGQYKIDWHNGNSKYHLSLHIDYPRKKDIERAKDLGLVAGSAIMIHGEPNYMDSVTSFFSAFDIDSGDHWMRDVLYNFDWTRGCVAVRNSEIEEMFKVVRDGTPIWIQP